MTKKWLSRKWVKTLRLVYYQHLWSRRNQPMTLLPLDFGLAWERFMNTNFSRF